MHTAEPLESEPSSREVEIVIDKLKKYKWAGNDQIQAQLIQAVGTT
jgi:hypothetical protein